MKFEITTLVGGETVNAHAAETCSLDTPCCIHAPSQHHMVMWPQHWRNDRKIMERMCEHGVGHPDPDDSSFRASKGDYDTLHGCDGCCKPPTRRIKQ